MGKYTDREIMSMSLFRALSILYDRADVNECEGDCDQDGLTERCDGCRAAGALNEVSEIARAAIRAEKPTE